MGYTLVLRPCIDAVPWNSLWPCTRPSRSSVRAAWGRSIARAIPGWTATWRSIFCQTQFVPDPERLARFRREAQLLASLNHPNIAAVYGLEEAQGYLSIALELVEGEGLEVRLARGRVATEEAIVSRGRSQRGWRPRTTRIVHRDLSQPRQLRQSAASILYSSRLIRAPSSSSASSVDFPTATHRRPEPRYRLT